MEYLKAELMELCHREQLYQIDLLNGSKERVTEREYWAKKKGQTALDERNAKIIASGLKPRRTKFDTGKDKLRQIIRKALETATSYDEFSELLLRQGISVKESRGRLSYLTPDRTKPITARRLGDDFDRTAVFAMFEQNAHRATETEQAIPKYHRTEKGGTRGEKSTKINPNTNGIGRIIDRDYSRAKGVGYDKWAADFNLKQMAATMNAYHEYGFSSYEEFEEAYKTASSKMSASHAEVKKIEAAIKEKKELQRHLLNYIAAKPTRDGLREQKSEKAREAYREKHTADFILSDTARRYFKEHGIDKLSAWVFGIIGTILGILGLAILLLDSITNGIIVLVIAFLVSPIGLPMLAAWTIGQMQRFRYFVQDAIYG